MHEVCPCQRYSKINCKANQIDTSLVERIKDYGCFAHSLHNWVALIYAPPANNRRPLTTSIQPINASPSEHAGSSGLPQVRIAHIPIFDMCWLLGKEGRKNIISAEIQFRNKTQTQIEKQNFQCHRTYAGFGLRWCCWWCCWWCVCVHPVGQKQTRWNSKEPAYVAYDWRLCKWHFRGKGKSFPDHIYRAVMVWIKNVGFVGSINDGLSLSSKINFHL